MKPIASRLVLHFPGFEPVTAEAHRQRYQRAGQQSASAFGFAVAVAPMAEDRQFPVFGVEAKGSNWATNTKIAVFDHNDYIANLRSGSFPGQVAKGYLAGGRVVKEGGLLGYFRQAWRFAIFFLVPYLLMSAALAASAIVAAVPQIAALSLWDFLWSVPLAAAAFWFLFLPLAERFLTMHLFADWRMAIAVARQNDPELRRWLDQAVVRVKELLSEPADEIVVTGHSMGATLAADVLGQLLWENPALFRDKPIAFITLGGAILQCALLKSADHLRRKVAAIARCADIRWIEVQCLTDAVHFYKTRTVSACSYPDLPQARLMLIRFKRMLTTAHYRKIKRDALRVHRQYVLGSDIRSIFDFTVLTAGPMAVARCADYNNESQMPLSVDGAFTG